MNSIQYKDYLQHFGVQGMKWGVRRYENPDGTLTAAGKARYGHYETSAANAKNDTAKATAEAKLRSSIRTGAQNDTRSMSTIAREGSSMSNQMSNIARTQGNAKIRKAKAAIDLSEMSDQDLQKAINRMNMEQNYKRLATADIASGHEHVNEILSTVGAGLAVTASALTIALSIQQLRHGSSCDMVNAFLAHHGIKGQKWGDRNGPPYPLGPEDHSANEKKEKWYYSLEGNTNSNSKLGQIAANSMKAGKLSLRGKHTSSNKNKASSKTTGPMKERVTSGFKKAGIMAQNGVRSEDIKTHKLFTARPLGDKGIKIAKGDIVQHVMSTPTKDMSNRDYLFVAATAADKANYGGFFAALTKYRNGVDQMYKMEMTAQTDIISPGKKERVKTFIEIYKDDPVKVATQLAEFNKRNYADQYKETTEQLVQKYSKMSMRELKGMGYYTYANSWFDPQAGTLKDMRSKLEAKGYNAIIDDNDKRSFVQSQAPLIVFDVMNNLGDVKVSKLSQGEIRRNMIDWQNMKHSDT